MGTKSRNGMRETQNDPNSASRHVKMATSLGSTWKKKLKTGLDGERFSLTYAPDGTGIELVSK